MSESVYAGLTSQTIDVFLGDSSSATGSGLTGLVHNSAGLTCYYRKGATGSSTAITLATQTVGGAWSSGGFVEIDSTNMKGVYRFDIPNAVVDTEGFATVYFRGATNLVATAIRVDCRPYPVDVKKFGGSNGTFSGGRPEVNTTLIEGSDATNQIRDSVVDDATRIDASALNTLSGHDPGETIMGATDLGTGSGLTSLATAAQATAIEADTQDLQSRIPAALTGDGMMKADTLYVNGTAQSNGDLNLKIDSRASQTSVDDLPTNDELATALVGLNDISPAEVNAEVDAAIETYHLHRLFHSAYDPTSEPGSASALLNVLVENDAGVPRFTANSLEQAPSGGGSVPTAVEIRQEIDSNSTQLAAIVADTNELQTDWANGGRLDLLLDAASVGGEATVSDEDKQEIAVLAAQAMEGVRVGVSFPPWSGGFRKIVQGDDYLTANGTAIAWSMTGATAVASFSGWSVKMKVSINGESAEQSGTITDETGDTRAGYIDWENFCADLPLGKGIYQFMFTDGSTKEVTLIDGKIELAERIAVA